MGNTFIEDVREFLLSRQGREVDLNYIRKEMQISPDSKHWISLGKIMAVDLTNEKIVKPSGKKDGVYKVITQVLPVRVFLPDRERRPPFELIFPREFGTGMEMTFAEYVVIREGDLVTLGGVKSKGKTTLCLSFCAENIDKNPVLMGNEYTTLIKDKFEPTARFFLRVDKMREWVEWIDAKGCEKFTLLPVRDDYAEHIVKDKINIIDWINLAGDRLFDIGKVLEGIKANLGRGVAIVALQKKEGALNPRGDQFVRDFSDLEILLDGLGDRDDDILLTIKGCKEKKKPIVGNTYAYTIVGGGTQIVNFREVKKCPTCWGKGWKKVGNSTAPCDTCGMTGYIDK